MLYAGLDLSRQKVNVHVLSEVGETVTATWVPATREGLRGLVGRVALYGDSVTAVVESMTGGRFVHDELELAGWDVELADAARAKALAPLAAKTDKIDARVLAELARRDLVPAVWLPDPSVRAERERARFRLHLVKHRTALKNRIHATLATFGKPVPVSDLFGTAGRELLARLEIPEPWATTLGRSLELVDDLDRRIATCEAELRAMGADHPYVPLLVTVPGIGPTLAYTIASEIGDIGRFPSPKRLAGYTGLCPHVYQSGEADRRGALTKAGPKYLRWALIEAAVHASRHERYAARYERTKRRLGKQRGSRIAQVELAREHTTAIWHMLTRQEPFRAAGPANRLVA
ncbi:MAG: IS110 family RNA-guided transposase [Candidatus Limnocylindrales bacterium]